MLMLEEDYSDDEELDSPQQQLNTNMHLYDSQLHPPTHVPPTQPHTMHSHTMHSHMYAPTQFQAQYPNFQYPTIQYPTTEAHPQTLIQAHTHTPTQAQTRAHSQPLTQPHAHIHTEHAPTQPDPMHSSTSPPLTSVAATLSKKIDWVLASLESLSDRVAYLEAKQGFPQDQSQCKYGNMLCYLHHL